MKPQHLTYKQCPVCSARPVSFHQPWQHTNGEWSEEIKFDCGCRIRYVPNFKKERIETQCPNHRTEKAKHLKREGALRKLEKYINKLDVDQDWKDKVLSHI